MDMKIHYDTIYKINSKYELCPNEDKYLYVNFDQADWFRTDEIGYKILSACDGRKSLDEVIHDIAQLYLFSHDFLKTQFQDFLVKAIESKVIAPIESIEKEEAAISTEENDIMYYPNDIWLHISSLCNLDCPFCYSRSGNNNTKTLNEESVYKFLSNIPEDRRRNILISGGEPFLYKNLVNFLKKLKEMRFQHLYIITNGTCGEDLYEEALPLLDCFQVSIDGTTPEVHDITRGKGSFKKTIRNLNLARELGIKELRISFTPTKHNIFQMPDLVEFAYDNKIDVIHLNRLLPIGRGYDNEEVLIPDHDENIKALEKLIIDLEKINKAIYFKRETEEMFLDEEKKTKKIQLSLAGNQNLKISNSGRKYSCGAGRNIISINYDGNIYPCASMHKEKYSFGNIETDTFSDIYLNAQMYFEQSSVDNPDNYCYSCKEKYFCGGGCKACADASGNYNGPDPSCELYLKGIWEGLYNLEL